jgi:hypothetical protein
MADNAPTGSGKKPFRNEYWLALAAAGVLMALPLSWLSFGLLLFVPGLSAYVLIRDRFRIVELVTLSFTLSLVLFALVTLVTMAAGVHGAPVLLGAFAIAVSLYRFVKHDEAVLEGDGWKALALAFAIAALVFVVLYFNTYTFRDGALYVQPTYACDSVFHLSIIERYVTAPQVPPQEPFLPGYNIVYNWLIFATIGELILVTGVELFLAYKIIVALVAGLIFLATYLLSEAVFRNEKRAALIAGFVFVAGAGLSWAYMLYQQYSGKTPDLFPALVYNWPDVMALKYDPVSLFFFLPQPQTFALLLMIAGMYMYYVTCRDRSWGFAVASGLTMAALVLFHLMSAFATLIPVGLYFLYQLFLKREAILGKKDFTFVVQAAAPLVICFFAGVYQLTLLTENAASHIEIGHHPDVYTTLLFALGPLIPFALYGAYRLWRDEGAALLIIFGLANFVFINVLELPRSMDTYRFLDFLSIPLAIFAGYAFWEMLKAPRLWKKALAVLVILLIVPSSLIMAAYYAGAAYQQAPADDVDAAHWLKDNTPASAIVFENPSPFPRVSMLSGHVVSYTGQYMDQFHGVNLQWPMEQIMRTTNSTQLHRQLVDFNVSYVFLGSQERGKDFVTPLKDPAYFTLVYGDESGQGTKIYQVKN